MRAEWNAEPMALLSVLAGDGGMEDGSGLGAANRAEFVRQGVVAVNLMGAPGSGRTRLVEATARALDGHRTGVLLAGRAVEAEAWRLGQAGVPAHTIPSRGCHVDAGDVDVALQEFAWRYLDYLFVENVGGLVSPARHTLGETARVVTLALPDGAELPLKYPDVFRSADLVVVTKADLLPFLPHVSLDAIAESLACVMRRPAFVVTSAFTGRGLAPWITWLERSRRGLCGEPARRPAAALEAADPVLVLA